MKKRYVWIGVGAVTLVAAVALFFGLRSKWVTLRDMPGYRDFSYDSIEKIRLLDCDLALRTEFEDEDLIAPWREYFKSVRIRRYVSTAAYNPDHDGIPPMAVVTAGGKDYSFYIYPGECELGLGKRAYVTDAAEDLFRTTFRESVERHGSTTPWD